MSLKREKAKLRSCVNCFHFKIKISCLSARCSQSLWDTTKKIIRLTPHQDLFLKQIENPGLIPGEVIRVSVVHRKIFDVASRCAMWDPYPCPVNKKTPIWRYKERGKANGRDLS